MNYISNFIKNNKIIKISIITLALHKFIITLKTRKQVLARTLESAILTSIVIGRETREQQRWRKLDLVSSSSSEPRCGSSSSSVPLLESPVFGLWFPISSCFSWPNPLHCVIILAEDCNLENRVNVSFCCCFRRDFYLPVQNACRSTVQGRFLISDDKGMLLSEKLGFFVWGSFLF